MDEYNELYKEYVYELKKAVMEEKEYLERIRQKNANRFSNKEDLEKFLKQRFDPVCCSGRVIAVFRKYWLKCDEINYSIDNESNEYVNPKEFVVDYLSGSNQELYDIISSMPYYPIGVDENGDYC